MKLTGSYVLVKAAVQMQQSTTEEDATRTNLLRMAARKMLTASGLDFSTEQDLRLLAQDIAEVQEEENLPTIADAAALLTKRIGKDRENVSNLGPYLACLRVSLPPRPKKAQP